MVNSNMDEKEKYLNACETEEKILCLSKQIDHLSKLKKDLETDLNIQKEMMLSSVQQGLTFNIPSSFYDEINDEDDFLLENKVNLGQLILYHTCLDKEVIAMKDLLQTNNTDMESLKELVQCEKLTNRKTLQKQSGKSFEIVYSGEKKDGIGIFENHITHQIFLLFLNFRKFQISEAKEPLSSTIL